MTNLNSEDGQWSEGLVSAARMVAAATHNLCESANALVKGHASEEKLIGAAKQVAGSTAQLLLACKVKADPESATMRRLEAASNQVRKATENLVKSAQQALDQEEEAQNIDLNKSAVNIVIEVIAISLYYDKGVDFLYKFGIEFFFQIDTQQKITILLGNQCKE